MGQQTRELAHTLLGLTETEIDSLIAEQVLEAPIYPAPNHPEVAADTAT